MKTARHGRSVAWAALLVCAWALPVWGAELDPKVDENLQWKIGQVIFNTIKGREMDRGPTLELMERFHNLGENQYGPSWGYKSDVEKSPADGKPVMIYLSITLVPDDYDLTDKQKANWKQYGIGKDELTGADIAFRSSTNKASGIRRHRTTYRLVRDGIRMNMHFTREGADNAKQAMQKSLERWQSFYTYAEKQGLFDTTEVVVTVGKVEQADADGALADFQVLHVRKGVKDVVKIPLTVRINSRSLEGDKPYAIGVLHKTPKGYSQAKLVDGNGKALQDSDGDGYLELWAKAPDEGGEAKATLELGRNDALRATPQQLLNGPSAMVRFALIETDNEGNKTIKRYKDVGVQSVSWQPIVSRFQVMDGSGQIQRLGESDSSESASRSFLPYRWSFTRMTDTMGTWFQVYSKEILPVASKAGTIPADQPVMLGWRKHPETLTKEFLVALDAPNETKIVAVPHRSAPRFALWVEIFGTPQASSASLDSDELSMDEDPGVSSGGSDPEIDTATFQENLERLIFVEDTKLVINRIYYIPKGMTYDAFEKELPKLLRLEPGGPQAKNPNDPDDPVSRPVPHLQAGASQMPFRVFRGKMLIADPVPFRDLALTPGIYELRFSTTIFHSEEAWGGNNDQKKNIDVGIRFAVYPSVYKPLRLDWQQQRLR
jgi:hypothetical protein